VWLSGQGPILLSRVARGSRFYDLEKKMSKGACWASPVSKWNLIEGKRNV